MIPYLKSLQAIELLFVPITKSLSSKIEETFCEGLKRMCKFFKIYGV